MTSPDLTPDHSSQEPQKPKFRIPIPPALAPLVAHFTQIYEICIWERGPRSLPSSLPMTLIYLVAYIGAKTVQYGLEKVWGGDKAWETAVYIALGDTLALLLLTFLLLFITLKLPRLPQALLALLATGTAVALLRTLTAGSLDLLSPVSLKTIGLYGTLLFPLLVWNVTIQASILRSTTEFHYIAALIVACLHAAACYMVLNGLAPPPLPMR
jgi:hypothetical protein